MDASLRITYIGGPTALLERHNIRFLTDPTFDRPGGEYTTGPVTLRKLSGPAISAQELGAVDFVLLTHDHHYDNLDHVGRKLLGNAKGVLTTEEGARRLGGNTLGLKPWQVAVVAAPDGQTLPVVATPARHGPTGMNRGEVIGFVLAPADAPERAIYISGDTVWYEGVAEVARRFPIRVALLHLGAARVDAVGPFHLTMTAAEAVEAARAFEHAAIVPIHFEGWAHFSEGREEIARAFASAGMQQRLHWPQAGHAINIPLVP